MTTGLLSLGTLTDLMDVAWSGWSYPNTGQVTQLLSSEASAGNAILQDGGWGFEQGTLELWAEADDRETLRAYYQARTEVLFVDYDGSTSFVRLFEIEHDSLLAGLWHLIVSLIRTPESAAS